MDIILIILIAISLSMDAFSLSIAYGTNSLKKREIQVLSSIVGIFHFFMPILGILIGSAILNIININKDIIVLIIFGFIGLNMIFDSFKEEKEVKQMKISEMFLFGFAVSIDSFSVGIGLNNISDNYILCSCIFSLISFFFTYIGLNFGNKLNKLIGKLATLIGGVVLIIFGIIFMLN